METCALAAATDPDCESTLMYSPMYSYEWGCMCCTSPPETVLSDPNTTAHAFWKLYSFEVLVTLDPPSSPPAMPPPSPPPFGDGYSYARRLKSPSDTKYCADWDWKSNWFMYECHSDANQKFYFESWPTGASSAARIRTVADTSKCLDWNPGNDALYFGGCHNGANQKFFFESSAKAESPSSASRLKSPYNTAYCVDWGHGDLYMHSCHDGKNQKFFFEP